LAAWIAAAHFGAWFHFQRAMDLNLLLLSQITPMLIAEWLALEPLALDLHPFISLSFALPAMRQLFEPDVVRLLVWRNRDGARSLAGVVPITAVPPRWTLPAPSWQVMSTPYSPLGGMLLHRDHAAQALEVLRRQGPRRGVSALQIPDLPGDSGLLQRLEALPNRLGAHWIEDRRRERAFLDVPRDPAQLLQGISRKKMGEIRRRQRRLAERGGLEWRETAGAEVTSEQIETFLALENAGWKGESGSSLLALPQRERFFREMAESFRQRGELLLTELLLEGRVISSQFCFLQRRTGYIFKSAYDETYREFGPGILNKIEQLAHLDPSQVDRWDSCTQSGSYIEEIWPQRQRLVTGTLVLNPALDAGTRLLRRGRSLVRVLNDRRSLVPS
jgi:CelD/BcsL family acetyltransferase involved in cellulose biosynthesis